MNCSRCGRENPDGLKFCQDCGNRLNAPAPAAEAPVAPPPAAAQPVVSPSYVVPRADAARPAAAPFHFAATTEKRCLRCGTGNPSNGRFCANCGSPLPADAAAPAAPVPGIVACSRCRGANAPHMGFCQFCGAKLSPGEPAAVPPAVTSVTADHELRRLSVRPANGRGRIRADSRLVLGRSSHKSA